MEALSVMVSKACDGGLFLGISIPKLLRCFYIASGLKTNLSKSNLYGVGVEFEEIEHMEIFVNCASGKLPFLHLGITIGANMNRIERKIHWVSWVKVCTPIKKGGLGLCKLEDANIALLCRWAWRFKNNTGSL